MQVRLYGEALSPSQAAALHAMGSDGQSGGGWDDAETGGGGGGGALAEGRDAISAPLVFCLDPRATAGRTLFETAAGAREGRELAALNPGTQVEPCSLPVCSYCSLHVFERNVLLSFYSQLLASAIYARLHRIPKNGSAILATIRPLRACSREPVLRFEAALVLLESPSPPPYLHKRLPSPPPLRSTQRKGGGKERRGCGYGGGEGESRCLHVARSAGPAG
eukprot:1189597-Prorocentrum_minimum.AAC.2